MITKRSFSRTSGARVSCILSVGILGGQVSCSVENRADEWDLLTRAQVATTRSTTTMLRLSVPLTGTRTAQSLALARALPALTSTPHSALAPAARRSLQLVPLSFGCLARGLRTSAAVRAEPIGVEVESAPAKEETSEPEEQTAGEKHILSVLEAKFQPSMLSVTDVSGGCGAFYTIIIASKAFNGLSTLKQHRLVQSELKNIIKDIHGLQVRSHPVPSPPTDDLTSQPSTRRFMASHPPHATAGAARRLTDTHHLRSFTLYLSLMTSHNSCSQTLHFVLILIWVAREAPTDESEATNWGDVYRPEGTTNRVGRSGNPRVEFER